MIKKTLLPIICFLLTGMALFAQNAFVDKPVAIVKLTKTDVISQKKLNASVKMYEQQAGRALNEEEKKQVLQTMINQILVFQAAERDKVTVSDEQVLQAGMMQLMQQTGRQFTEEEYKQFIKAQTGVDYSVYAQSIHRQLVLEKYVSEKKRDFLMKATRVTDKEIQRFYRENEEKFLNPEMVSFKHIFFATAGPEAKSRDSQSKTAREVYKKLQSGKAAFSDMVHEYSDDKNSVVRDGDIGSFIDISEPNIAVFGKEFLNSVFDLKVGELSPVLESNQGFHIVKLTKHYDKRFLNLDDPVTPIETTTVRDYIRRVLQMQNQQKAFGEASEQVVKELDRESEVKTFPENIL